MRRLLPFLSLALVAFPAASAATSPKLSVTDRSPFTVRGHGFAPQERVRVVVTAAGEGTTRWSTSGPGGGLTVQFPTVKLGSCPAYAVRAFGAKGSRATLRFTPECPQPLDP
jgi:hypothetical protein